MKIALWLVVSGVAMAAGNWLDLWPATVVVGVVLGLLLPLRRALWIGAVAGGVAWVAPLALLSWSAEILKMAQLIGNILGLGSVGSAVVFLLQVLTGALLAVSGAWIMGAWKSLFTSRQASVSRQASLEQ